MLKIGSHVSMSGKDMYEGSVNEAVGYGATAFMVYTGAPQNTIRKAISDLNIDGAKAAMAKAGLSFSNVVVHAPYIMNLANPDPEKRAFAKRFLTEEIRRTHAMGADQIVLHPGSAVGKDRDMAITWIAEGLFEVLSLTSETPVRIALETMAGKGNEVGKTFEELRAIIDRTADNSRLSVCFDTCHTHDAGYDIVGDYEGVMRHFDEVVGLERISVIHVNDSKNVRGAAKDRHENIGFGHIGFDALMGVIYDSRFESVPKILETPYIEGHAPYGHEIAMIISRTFDITLKDTVASLSEI
jgi:deoxyribonuclease IV